MLSERALWDRLALVGQEHLLRYWDELSEVERGVLGSEIESIDWGRVDGFVRELVLGGETASADVGTIEPIEVTRNPGTVAERGEWDRARGVGEVMLGGGEVAVVLVAGGQGTRLGFDGPKGTYPIGGISGASLFEIHAEKIVALGRRYGRSPAFFVMTSPENHEETVAFFDSRDRFGLAHVRFFMQGRLPAVDMSTGKALLAARGRLALAPDGHGGAITALARTDGGRSCLEEMAELGCGTVFTFQVDNPLVRIADPEFLGMHRGAGAEVSFKVVEKREPGEKVGVVVRRDGRPTVIEYSDLPAALAEERRGDGGLAYWAGSIAIHVFERGFLERVAREGSLPMHRAVKKVAFVNGEGVVELPSAPNAVKFESFIFDSLPMASRSRIVETLRAEEFEPLKNPSGTESPESVRQRMSDLYASWLERAGVVVPRRGDGSSEHMIEISPLFAIDAEELAGRGVRIKEVTGPLYLGPC